MSERVKLPEKCSENCMKMIIQSIKTNEYLTQDQKQMLVEGYKRDYGVQKLTKDIEDIIKEDEKQVALLLHKKRKAD
jgi:hypothetical protein